MTEDPDEPQDHRPAGPRRRGREIALGFLFACDVRKRWTAEDLPEHAAQMRARGPAMPFAERLVAGVIAHRGTLDEAIHRVATNWRMGRMAAVDRNILRVAAFELLFETETPRSAVINEAVELAKKFGSAQSGAFVNGILDKIRGPSPVA